MTRDGFEEQDFPIFIEFDEDFVTEIKRHIRLYEVKRKESFGNMRIKYIQPQLSMIW